jgi:alkylhydroperoxidase/carboxymuconolactone decarboxylase family protein YurZ
MKNIDPSTHVRFFKKVIRANEKIMEVDIINLFGFTLRYDILEWGKKFVHDHLNCTFEELEQTFCKHFQTMENDEKIYMQLKNLHQKVSKWVELYYKCSLKLVNCLQVKATNVFLIIIFRTSL